MTATPEETVTAWWAPLWRFAVHVTVAVGIFVLVAIPAVVLELLVRLLIRLDVSNIIIGGLRLAEFTIFGVDVLLLVTYAIRTGWRAGKQL